MKIKSSQLISGILTIEILSGLIVASNIKKVNATETINILQSENKEYYDINDLFVTKLFGKYYIMYYLDNEKINAMEINHLFKCFNQNSSSNIVKDSYSISEYLEFIDMLNIDETKLLYQQGGIASLEQLNEICARINEEMNLQQEKGKSLKLD